MPCPFGKVAVLVDNGGEIKQCPGIETITFRDVCRRGEPELRFAAITARVHVHRLARIALVSVEEESESFEAKHDRHEDDDRSRSDRPIVGHPPIRISCPAANA